MTHPRVEESLPRADGAGSSVLVRLSVGDDRYALPLAHVREVVRMVAVAPLPDAPPGVVGVINLRGRVIPVISLRARVGLPPKEPSLSDRIVVAEDGGRVFGLLVDGVHGVAAVGRVEAQSLAGGPGEARPASVAIVDGDPVPILDPATLQEPRAGAPSPQRPERPR
jgi:purine-binding chemotaxis protein CheW